MEEIIQKKEKKNSIVTEMRTKMGEMSIVAG